MPQLPTEGSSVGSWSGLVYARNAGVRAGTGRRDARGRFPHVGQAHIIFALTSRSPFRGVVTEAEELTVARGRLDLSVSPHGPGEAGRSGRRATRRGAAWRCGSVLLCCQSAVSRAGGCSCGSLATSMTVVVRPTCGCLLNLRSGTAFGIRLESTGLRTCRAVPGERRGAGGRRERGRRGRRRGQGGG